MGGGPLGVTSARWRVWSGCADVDKMSTPNSRAIESGSEFPEHAGASGPSYARSQRLKDVTRILGAIEAGDARASEELLPLVYEELRELAARRLASERAGQTLQATALVHEAYLRLLGDDGRRWNSRGHFFAAAAQAMRRILIDRARGRRRARHGGGRRRLGLDDVDLFADELSDDLIDLDAALRRLAAEDKKKADLVELRFFAGLTLREAAEFLDISIATADRYWAYARAWLFDELQSNDGTHAE